MIFQLASLNAAEMHRDVGSRSLSLSPLSHAIRAGRSVRRLPARYCPLQHVDTHAEPLFSDRLFNDSVRARRFSTEQDRPLPFSLMNLGDYGGSVEVAAASRTRPRIKG